ncbi:MAG: hypothetical protein Q9191_000458 [Dirinaria sp. TL-2023a]
MMEMHPAEDTVRKKRKRRRSDDSVDEQSRILLLEEQILESQKNFNHIVTLLDNVRGNGASTGALPRSLTLVALCRIFFKLIATGNLSKSRQASQNEEVITQWLNDRLDDYKATLLENLSEENPESQTTALTLLMKLVKGEAEHLHLSEESIWRRGTFSNIVATLLSADAATTSRHHFVDKYVDPFVDIRYHIFRHLGDFAKKQSNEIKIGHVISILADIRNIPEKKEDIESFFVQRPSTAKHDFRSLAAHKRRAQEAWLAILRYDLNNQQRKIILGFMSHRIAPWFLKPELLMDFLTDAFDEGGSSSLMALSGLFYLIQERNLDYPQFYQKLYSLIDANMLHSKHRSQFFRLLDTFLSSTHLPAALVASFIKRLSRHSLYAPPSAIVFIVPWIYNLLKTHSACTFMIHRATEGRDGEDPFLLDETDPMETDAIESSLWEIHTLQDHYHPNVATIARIIAEQFTKQAYNLEDFLDHSYDSDIKKIPEIEYQIPKKIFAEYEVAAGRMNSFLIDICNFN